MCQPMRDSPVASIFPGGVPDGKRNRDLAGDYVLAERFFRQITVKSFGR